jgi:ABC-type uncharacterized transport system substrate-binding protein
VQLEQLAAEHQVIDLTRLTMRELKQRVASLPFDSAIIYLGLTLDADNVAYTSFEALAAFAPVANRPIIVQSDTNVGTGAVGGIVASFPTMGREAAQLALRILAGEDTGSIPVTTGKMMKPVFDARQLRTGCPRTAKLDSAHQAYGINTSGTSHRPSGLAQFRAP